jgi:triosephosphate isomerase (TIM)
VRRRLVVGNWKMHGTVDANRALLAGLLRDARRAAGAEMAVCVPFPYLSQVAAMLAGTEVAWGAQNVSEHASGAYTGEVSAAMLKEFECRFVIVGHSERRALYGETDAIVAAKFQATCNAGMTPVLCVGERLEDRERGATADVVLRQLDAVLNLSGAPSLAKAVLAYEPVWAIGTGKTASPAEAEEVHALLRARIAKADAKVAADLTILYGGSVKGSNAGELFAMPDIDGGLIGGASLKADEFIQICEAAAKGRR